MIEPCQCVYPDKCFCTDEQRYGIDVLEDHTFEVTRRSPTTSSGQSLQWHATCSCGWTSQAFTNINIVFNQIKGHVGILGAEHDREIAVTRQREADRRELEKLRKVVADNELVQRFVPFGVDNH